MNAHLAGNICATRPNRSSGRRRPPRRRRCPSATHRPALRSIDRRSKSASDPRTLLAPPPIPAATPAASSALQCAEKRRGGARLAMHDDGSAGCSSAGPVAPYSRVTCRRPDDSLAPPLMEGRSAPLPPRRRWEGHWWWPGRPSAAARGARAAVAACARVLRAARSVLRNARSGGPRSALFFFLQAKFEPIEETQAGRLEALRDGRCSPSARPDFRIALPKS